MGLRLLFLLLIFSVSVPAQAGFWGWCREALGGGEGEAVPVLKPVAVARTGGYRDNAAQQVRVPAIEEVYAEIILSLARERGMDETDFARVTPASLQLVPLEPEGISMGATFVTQFVYFAVTGKNPSYFRENEHADGDAYYPFGGHLLNHPVESLTRQEEDEFFVRFREAAKQRYPGIDGNLRRPTEEEWFAADGGKEWSEGEVRAHTWVDGTRSHAVAQKPANHRGIYESRGHMYSALEEFGGSYRVLRGGSWGGNARYVRSDQRSNDHPGNRSSYVGFRVVRAGR
jgi:formylglycine-generating enzyme required for sulfatase activity